jgi:hypothetical protein
MSDLVGAPRFYVEEYVGRRSLQLKKEVEDGDQTICYYGDPLDEEGYWEYTYNKNSILVSYRKLEDVLEKIVKKDIDEDLGNFVIIGAKRKETEEMIRKYMFFVPISDEDIKEEVIEQKYGIKEKNNSKAYIIVSYDKAGRVVDRKLI